MDFLFSQQAAIQRSLAFVSTDPIDWKFYVQICSWSVCLFESYLLYVLSYTLMCVVTRSTLMGSSRLRQYPLYSKKTPPPVLAQYFPDDLFEKSQLYGKDKAKFSLLSGLYRQTIDSLMLHFGIYAWAWSVGGSIIAKLGYGQEYQVCVLDRPMNSCSYHLTRRSPTRSHSHV